MGQSMPPSRLGARLRLLWGKVRRFYLGVFRPRYVRRSAARRHGECRRCGACCKLALRCWSLDEDSASAACVRHETRPMNCRVFPVDERDLADRDLVSPDTTCGFYFDGVPATKAPAPENAIEEQAPPPTRERPVSAQQMATPQSAEVDSSELRT